VRVFIVMTDESPALLKVFPRNARRVTDPKWA